MVKYDSQTIVDHTDFVLLPVNLQKFSSGRFPQTGRFLCNHYTETDTTSSQYHLDEDAPVPTDPYRLRRPVSSSEIPPPAQHP